jgi:hypothetical protein
MSSWVSQGVLKGATGPAGPSAVSANANNKATLGSDSLILVQGAALGAAATIHGQTVSGDDPQLTNARTPTAHGSTHTTTDLVPTDGVTIGVVANKLAVIPQDLDFVGDWTRIRFEDFAGVSSPWGSFISSVLGAAAAVSGTGTGTSFGVFFGTIWCSTGTTSTGRANVSASNASVASGGVYGVDVAVRFAIHQLSTAVDTFRAIWGFCDAATPANMLAVEVGAGGNNNIRIASGTYASPTYTDTGVAMAANTWHTVRLVMNAAWTSLAVYVDGSLNTTITSGFPSAVSLFPWLGIIKTGGSTGTTVQYALVDSWEERYLITGR